MKLYSPEEMAELLGISVHTIYSKTSKRTCEHSRVQIPPYIKIGRLIRFPHEDYVKWLETRERHHVAA